MSSFKEAVQKAHVQLEASGDNPVASMPTTQDFASILRFTTHELRHGHLLQALKIFSLGMFNLARR